MCSATKYKISRFLPVFLIVILVLAGTGVYVFQSNKKTIQEDSIPSVEEKIVVNKQKKSKKQPEEAVVQEIPMENPILEPEEAESNEPVEETINEEKSAETEVEISNTNGVKKELTTIYIPLTKSLFTSPNISRESFQSRMMQPEHPVVFGKSYYQGENGKLESSLRIDAEGNLHEQLHSFDSDGNLVDNIEIGFLSPEPHPRKYATLSVNKLSVFEISTTSASGKKEERVTEYSITPQLQFRKGKTFSKITS
jgi:hypothetical protein